MKVAKRSKWQQVSSRAAPLQPLVIVLLVHVVDVAVVAVVPEPLLLLPRVATTSLAVQSLSEAALSARLRCLSE